VHAIINIVPPGARRMASTAGQASHMQMSTNPTLLNVSVANQRCPSQIAGANRIDSPMQSSTTPEINAIQRGNGFEVGFINKLPTT
jgi:hypothetical protein